MFTIPRLPAEFGVLGVMGAGGWEGYKDVYISATNEKLKSSKQCEALASVQAG